MAREPPRPALKRGFLCFVDTAGHRHAVRVGAITALSDADELQTETLIVMYGRGAVPAPYDLDAVLDEIVGRPARK